MYYLEEVKHLRNKLKARRNAGEHAKCVFIGEKLLQLHKKNRNTRSMNFADDIFNLAIAYEEMGKLERAKILYGESLRITEALYGQGIEYSERLTNLAIVLAKMGKEQACFGMLTRAEEIKREYFGAESVEYAAAMQNTANCLFDLGQVQKAMEKHLRVLKIREAKKDISYADSLNSLGECNEELGNIEEAKSYYTRALAATAEICGRDTEEYVSGVMYYADFLCQDNQYEEAAKQYNKALRIYGKLYSGQILNHAAAIGAVAEGFEKIDCLRKALQLKLRALNLMEKSVGGVHIHFANIYRDIAKGFRGLGDFKAAVTNIRKARRMRETLVGRVDDDYVKDTLALCLFYLDQEDYKRLAATLKSAVKGIDIEAEGIPSYFKGLRELSFLTSEMSKLSKDISAPNSWAGPLSGDIKKMEALSELLKMVRDDLAGEE